MVIQPIEIERVRAHEFVGSRQPRQKCEICRRVFSHVNHHAYPESFNVGGSGYNIFAYQNAKKAWTEVFMRLLEEAELPRPLARLVVEGELTFPRRFAQGPDQENYRYPLSKFLGDTLETGGWLKQDDWSRFEFGGLSYRLEPRVQRMRLMLFPTLADESLGAAA